MAKRILLINPWIHDFAAYDFWIKPLGLLYLGGLLRRNHHQVYYLDCLDPYHPSMMDDGRKMPRRRSGGDGKFFRQMIPKPDALRMMPKNYCRYGILPDVFSQELHRYTDVDLILVTSMMTYWYPGVFEVIGLVKKAMPSVPVVLGGKYATLCYNHAVEFSGADYVLAGEGEDIILQFMQNIFNEKPVFSPGANLLDSRPYPAFDLIANPQQLPIITSQGCPYKCSYCCSPVLYDSFNRRDPFKVVDEIEYWQKNLGVVNFSFYDDALLVNPSDMIIPLLEEISRRHLSCRFHCPNGLHLREITKELSESLFRGGFKTIRFGFETSNCSRQKTTGGKVKNEELRTAVGHLKNAGYTADDIGIYLLCGLPGQKAGEVMDSIDFVKDCGARPILAEYSPIPGTPMWEDAALRSCFDITAEPLYHNNSLLPCRSEDFSFDVYEALKKTLKPTGHQDDRA